MIFLFLNLELIRAMSQPRKLVTAEEKIMMSRDDAMNNSRVAAENGA